MAALVTVRLWVLSELSDEFEPTDVVVKHIQSITDSKIAGQHILCTIRLKGQQRELLVNNRLEEIELLIEYAHIHWDKRGAEFWSRMQAIVNNVPQTR
jgi:hypothetical protein